MPVRYINVESKADMFSPVVRATGNVAVIGTAETGTENEPVPVTSPSEAAKIFGVALIPDPNDTNKPPALIVNSSLTAALVSLFGQTPGPAQVWGVRAAGDNKQVDDPTAALSAIEELDVQFVVLARTPLTTGSGAAGGAIEKLADHVASVSTSGGEGKERMGVAMLAKDNDDPAVVTSNGKLVSDRMVYVAHRSDDDAAAAVAGTVAGYPPHISMLLKKVAIKSPPFKATQIDKINQSESVFGQPPAGNGVNWLVDPPLIPGGGVYLGEGYTGDPGGGVKFIDVRRTIDDISFRLKARLIRAVGDLRISRTGLRALVVQMEAVLDPLVRKEVIENYSIIIPVLDLLDSDPSALTPAQLQEIQNAQANRVVRIAVSLDYAGAIHRIALSLNFQ